MSRTISYGDGWITGIDPAALDASITALLTEIRESPWQAEYELTPGEMRCGPAGTPPTHLMALDGATRIPLTP